MNKFARCPYRIECALQRDRDAYGPEYNERDDDPYPCRFEFQDKLTECGRYPRFAEGADKKAA